MPCVVLNFLLSNMDKQFKRFVDEIIQLGRVLALQQHAGLSSRD